MPHLCRGSVTITPERLGRDRWITVAFPGRIPPRWLAVLDPGRGVRTGGKTIWRLPWDDRVMHALQRAFPWLRPVPAGPRPSVGLGDRIGQATEGHLLAMRGTGLFPVVAQQSIREMTRTQRSPADVMRDAVWGVLAANWRSGFGADADHLKTVADVDRTAAAGFVLFPLDATDVIGPRERRGATPAARWGRAVDLFTRLARRVRARAQGPFELELSLDELPFATALADHRYVVTELGRRSIRVHQLAPKFPGAFEKAVAYRGDRRALAAAIAGHARLARALGGHKLSIHSGSDKFTVYPLVARLAGTRFHLKTAGTWYLEALRVAARKDPPLFREIAQHSRAAYARDRATYHLSARLSRVPSPARVPDARLERVFLGPDDARQVLHVGFGSVLTARTTAGWRFRDRLADLLAQHDGLHMAVVGRHLRRHLRALRR